MDKHWKVTAYYPLTEISIVVEAEDEERAEEIALEIIVDEWGKSAYRYEHMHTVEADWILKYWKYTAHYEDTSISTTVIAPNENQARMMASQRIVKRHGYDSGEWKHMVLDESWTSE
jgi:hypothetical protein